jgi:hypothetical protein
MKRNDTLGLTLAAAFWSLLLVVSSSWVADGLNDDCLWEWLLGQCRTGSGLPGAGRVLFAAALFGAAALFVYRIAKSFVRVRHLARAEVTPHAGLIAAISPFAASLEKVAGGLWLSGKDHKGKDHRVRLTGQLAADIGAISDDDWPWPGQQFLRALLPHVGSGILTELALIGSKGGRGSFGSLPLAKELASLYCPTMRVQSERSEIDFEDVEALARCFDGWIDRLIAGGLSEADIVIDATGGTKTASIAAALTTLHRPQVQFQYVQTQPSASDGNIHVIAFDVVAESVERQAAA